MSVESEQELSAAERRRAHLGLGLATRIQLNARQFMTRRAALGLTRRQVRMETEPGRRQTMAVAAGITITVVICLGALFWSVLRPAGSVGNSTIVADQASGALYVRVGSTLYPALNLASARLIAGTPDNPARARRSDIDSWAKGPLVGIPGAPSDLTVSSTDRSSWLVCDSVTKAFGTGAPEPVTVTVIDGAPDLGEGRRTLGASDAVLLRYGDEVWLIRDGRRSKVDPAARPVLVALGLPIEALATARPMSRALLDVIPVGPALTVPVIPGAGGPAGFPGAPGPVGTVVSTPQAGGQVTYSVVLPTGMQLISAGVARILQNAGGSAASMPTVAGPVLAALPAANTLDVSVYPDQQVNFVDTQSNPSTCWWWQRGLTEARASTQVVSGPTVPVPVAASDKVVSLVRADKTIDQADRVFFAPGYTNYVLATGNDVDAATKETFWWITESGARFGVARDQDTFRALGIGTPTLSAPWAALRLLAAGPELSHSDALVRHDSLPTDLTPGGLEIPKP